MSRGEARVTAVKMGPAPADAVPAVPGGEPADVLVEVEATMVGGGGATVTAQAKEILQVGWDGIMCVCGWVGPGGMGRGYVGGWVGPGGTGRDYVGVGGWVIG